MRAAAAQHASGDPVFLNLFPIPRRYERLPGALAFTLAAAMVILYFKERSAPAAGALLGSLVLLAAVYAVRMRQRAEWSRFFDQENRSLLEIRGAAGPGRYTVRQRRRLGGLRHPELRTAAAMNLVTGLLADAKPAEAAQVLSQLDPQRMPNPTLRLVYWTQQLGVSLQQADASGVETAYQAAMDILPEVSDMLKISFLPSEIQYHLFRGEFQLALNQLGELPDKDLDESGRDLLLALRIAALRGLGVTEKANKLSAQLESRDLLPSTRLAQELGAAAPAVSS